MWESTEGKRGRWRRDRQVETEGKHALLTLSGNETSQKGENDKQTVRERKKTEAGRETRMTKAEE